jgi:hypothetical protein
MTEKEGNIDLSKAPIGSVLELRNREKMVLTGYVYAEVRYPAESRENGCRTAWTTKGYYLDSGTPSDWDVVKVWTVLRTVHPIDMTDVAAKAWSTLYPDRRPWSQLEQSTRDEWTRMCQCIHDVLTK